MNFVKALLYKELQLGFASCRQVNQWKPIFHKAHTEGHTDTHTHTHTHKHTHPQTHTHTHTQTH